MLKCYITIGQREKRNPSGMAYGSAYLNSDVGTQSFSHHWRQLLLRHELPSLMLEEWKKRVTDRDWSQAKQLETLEEFLCTADAHGLLGMFAGIEPAEWATLDAGSRKYFGTSEHFCFFRLIKSVLDRLEATNRADTIVIVLDSNSGEFAYLSALFQRLYEVDSRAKSKIASVCFIEPRRDPHMQAAILLAAVTTRAICRQTDGRVKEPRWLKLLKALPDPPKGLIVEHWDRAFMARNQHTLEWATARDRPDIVRKSRRDR